MASSEVKHQIECCQMGLNNTSEKKNLIHYFYQLERNPHKMRWKCLFTQILN